MENRGRLGWYSLEKIWVITNIIRFNILSQNLEKDIQKYFVITRQLKLENIEPVLLALVSASMPT